MKKIFALLLALVTAAHADAGVGSPAPAFTLKNCAGGETSLSDYKGKTVVLEWTTPSCPFVAKHYSSGNMQKLQKEALDKGVVWLTICSSAPGKPGYQTPAEAAAACTKNGSAATAYLIDDTGSTGRLYGAKRTPEMFVIDPKGLLVYHGAIDDKRSTNPADIAGAKNFVSAAMDETLAGKPVTVPKTEAYGCGIKYAE